MRLVRIWRLNKLDETISPSPFASLETNETVALTVEVFNQRMDDLHGDFSAIAICLGVIVGCIIAVIVFRWFHND